MHQSKSTRAGAAKTPPANKRGAEGAADSVVDTISRPRSEAAGVVGAERANEPLRSPDPAAATIGPPLARIIKASRARLSEDNIARIVDVLLPGLDPAGPVLREIETDNARARVDFFEAVPTLTNAELAAQAGHEARNQSATGARWKAARKAFSVTFKGLERFPAFQFSDGRPRPVIGRVLALLPDGMTPWQVAFWFVSSNPWLDGHTPEETLGDEEAVLAAARMEGAPAAG